MHVSRVFSCICAYNVGDLSMVHWSLFYQASFWSTVGKQARLKHCARIDGLQKWARSALPMHLRQASIDVGRCEHRANDRFDVEVVSRFWGSTDQTHPLQGSSATQSQPEGSSHASSWTVITSFMARAMTRSLFCFGTTPLMNLVVLSFAPATTTLRNSASRYLRSSSLANLRTFAQCLESLCLLSLHVVMLYTPRDL